MTHYNIDEHINLDTNLKTDDDISNDNFKLTNNLLIIEKKKRGRKPKNKINNIDTCVLDDNTNTNINSINNNETIRILKKRGRKPTGKVIEMDRLQNINDVSFSDCLIAHLKLDKKDIDKIMNIVDKTNDNNTSIFLDINEINDDTGRDLSLDKTIIQNENNKDLNFFSGVLDNNIINNKIKLDNINSSIMNHIEINNVIKTDLNLVEKNENNNESYFSNNIIYENRIKKNDIIDLKVIDKKIIKSNVNFYNNNNTCTNLSKDKSLTQDSTISDNKWELTTNINCWWCCHEFDNIPLGIPTQYIKNTFYLYGCFCSFNCCLSYNLDMNDYKLWDRQSLIYYLKNIIDPENEIIIRPAPPRQILDKFGGSLNIEQFRKSFYILDKNYNYILPHMVSVITYIEENILGTKINNPIKNNFINPINNTFSDKLVLKRTKPLPTKNKLHIQSVY